MGIQNFNWGTRSGATGPSITVALPISGSRRKVVVAVMSETAIALNALTFNGTSILADLIVDQDVGGGAARIRLYYYDVPDVLGSATYDVVSTFASNSSNFTMYAWQLSNAASGAPESFSGFNNTSGSSISTNVTASLNATVIGAFIASATGGSPVWTSPIVLRQAGGEANYKSLAGDYTAASAGTVAVGITGDGVGVNRVVAGISVAEVLGPNITTQPTAQTSRLNGEVGGPAVTFTAAAEASTGNITAITVKKDGVTITDGGVYDIVATGVGSSPNGSVSIVVTPTDLTLDGSEFTVDFVDSGGTTTSVGAILTVKTGPTFTPTSGTTDGSGQEAFALAQDEASTLVITRVTGGGVTKYITNSFT